MYIGGDKRIRVSDRIIHMRFGCKVNHSLEIILLKERLYEFSITDIPLYKSIVKGMFYLGKVGQIPCISEFI